MSDALPPLPLRWTGEAFEPASPGWARRCDALLVAGQTYTLVEHQERSSKTHAHFFASVHELWQSLPEALTAELPSPDHARRRALIMTGHHTQQDVVCASKAETLRLAAMVKSLDEYAVAVIKDNVVKILRAKSQDYRSMDRATFAASKQSVLDYLSDLVGSDPRQSREAA